jgi:RNA recognition motif-containing protein
LLTHFSECNGIEDAVVKEDRHFGFVTFYAVPGALKARNSMDGSLLHGNRLHVKFAKGTPSKVLWVGSLSPTISDIAVVELFSQCGISLENFHSVWLGKVDKMQRRPSKSSAQIWYFNVDDASRTMAKLQGYYLDGMNIIIGYGKVSLPRF